LQIRSLHATFGKLQQAELSLYPGLNLIYAPNESGKSTWSAFLRNMLYGLPTRDRSPLADKHRYAPWSGAPMQGRMEILTADGAYTVIRQTQRANSPMGSFSCTYSGTTTPVPGITGPELGQQLLGIPREVFERSAFISQSGLPVDQNGELERRIAALITTGDEDTSFSESYERLKKQLNRRKHNRTGLIPNLERDLEHLRERLDQLKQLQLQLDRLQEEDRLLSARQTLLQQQLAEADRWELFQKQQALQNLTEQKNALQATVQKLQLQLDTQQIPDRDTTQRLSAAIRHTVTLSQQTHQARELQEQAKQDLAQLEEKIRQSALAGRTIQDARQLPHNKPKVPRQKWLPLMLLLLPLAGALYLGYNLQQAALPVIASICLPIMAAAWYRLMQRRLLIAQFGTADPAALERLAESYIESLQKLEELRAEAAGKAAAAQQLRDNLDAARHSIIQELQRYAPAITQLSDGAPFLSHANAIHQQLAQGEEHLRLISLRWELARREVPETTIPVASNHPTPPAAPQPQIQNQLLQVQADLTTLRSHMDRLTGQLRASGDRADLESQIEQLQEQLRQLQAEYDAIALAMDALSRANTTLQNRFSPELGAKAAEILSRFTGGRYDKVLLNKDFALSTQESNDPAQHSIQLLSQGTADQAYLAVRLAICQLVLPQGKAIPLVLDDVFANFDEPRLYAALDWLVEESQNRQILLFTCQKREGEYLKDRPGVVHLTL